MGGGVSRPGEGTGAYHNPPPPLQGHDDDVDDDEGVRCPITQEVMNDPVICADGHSYERAAIEEWFRTKHKTSPLTNERLIHMKVPLLLIEY